MANNPNHMDNLTPFSSTYRPKNPGRKPSHLKKWIKNKRVSSIDIRILLGGIIGNLKRKEDIDKILEDPKTPPIILIPLRCLLHDWEKYKMDTYKFLIEYGYGKAVQPLEHSGNLFIDKTPPELRKAKLKELMEKYKEREETDESNKTNNKLNGEPCP